MSEAVQTSTMINVTLPDGSKRKVPQGITPYTECGTKVWQQLKDAGIRAELDARNEKMNAKIREHTLQKVPFLLVVGEKEAEAGTVNVRGQQQPEETVPISQFVERRYDLANAYP